MELAISSQESVKLGSVIRCSASSEGQRPVEIVTLPEVEVNIKSWWYATGRTDLEKEIAADGWTRYNACDAVGRTFGNVWPSQFERSIWWLSQANHIFSRLKITSNYEDYFSVNRFIFGIQISPTPQPPPEGFLFLCPQEDFSIGSNSFWWSDCPAYWSFDPSGVNRLNMEGATALGFPAIELETILLGQSWNDSVYAGLRQFHEAQGFDPESQDVARYLGYPLYELSDDMFAHVDNSEDYVRE
ncbi:hypothetical protein C8R43DRAFT_1010577 [Mycena crocata]|nr:hypothetical protein C8R43DRAFT_1010577 [Mycena crocata]